VLHSVEDEAHNQACMVRANRVLIRTLA
jgi:hypothetical protein